LGRLIALTLALLAGALVAWGELRAPRPAGAGAPAADFSAARAQATVRALARTPRPTGSAAAHAAREQILKRMRALGLSARIRRGDVLAPAEPGGLSGASPESLIGVLPGRDPAAPAVALMAHYDSRPGAPGAADDAAGVAAALEIVRAIQARGTPLRDVAVIITDAEEACLCGAREVFAHDPIAKRLGLVLNLEARGSGGRALMFETGHDDGPAMKLFRDSAIRPLTGSIFAEVYARLPNDTDFSVAKAAGLPGFNYAFAGRAFDYHQPTDTVANLDPGALQDLGQQVLATASAAAFSPRLPERGADVTHSMLFGRAIIAYPPAWGWAPLALAAALIALAMGRARRRSALPWTQVARGAAAGLYALALGAVLLHLARAVGVAFDPEGERRLLAQAGRFEAGLLLVGLGALLFAAAEAARGRRSRAVVLPLLAALAVCLASAEIDGLALAEGALAALLALSLGREPIERPAAWAGVLCLGLAAGAGLQVAAPLAAYTIAWPVVLAALAAACTNLAADRRVGRLVALAFAGVLAAGWTGVYAHLVVVVAGLPELLVLPMLMAAPALWPLAQPDEGAPPARLGGRMLLIVGAALVLWIRLDDPWSARHPRRSMVAYHLDQDAARAWRVTPKALRTAWSDATLRANGAAVAAISHWAWRQPSVAAAAPLAAISPPTVSVVRLSPDLAEVTVAPPAGVRALNLQLSSLGPARLESVGEAPAGFDLPTGTWTRLTWAAPPEGGLRLRVRARDGGQLRLRYAMVLDGWPKAVIPPSAPPAGVMPVDISGETVASGARRLTW